MSEIQHAGAMHVLSMIESAVAEGSLLTYAQVAANLGRNPSKEGRAVAAFCDLLDAAAALAGVPSVALLTVRENGTNKINARAWRGSEVPGWLREEIIERARRHTFQKSDFRAIEAALVRLKGMGNRSAWKYLREELYPGTALHHRMTFGGDDLIPEGTVGGQRLMGLTKEDFEHGLIGASRKRALLIYLTKESLSENLQFDSVTREITSGFWTPAVKEFERVIIYQKFGDRNGSERALVWAGDNAGQKKGKGDAGIVFCVRNVEGPFFTSLSFKGLTGVAGPQRGWVYCVPVANLRGGINAAGSANDEIERQTAIKKEIWVRRYQGYFKSRLTEIWGNRCAVTDVTELTLLRASHVRPWANSTHVERLSKHNGLLLSAHLDALFDRHLISFDEIGKIKISATLSRSTRKAYGLHENLALRIEPWKELREYLKQHREKLVRN